MATFTSIAEAIRGVSTVDEKQQLVAYILNACENHRVKLLPADRQELSALAFSELNALFRQVSSCKNYREKDRLLSYEDSLMGLVMLCHPSPDELSPEKMEQLKQIQDMVRRERFLEYAIDEIFECGSNEPEEIQRLLCMLTPLKDEYHKGRLYHGLIYHKDRLQKLPKDSHRLFSEYILSELNRWSNEGVTEEIRDVIEFACDACKHFRCEGMAEGLRRLMKASYSNVNFYALETLLEWNETVPQEVIDALAEDMEFANLTYNMLREFGKETLFPAHRSNPEYLATSDMVHWLIYPTELGEMPDRIEHLGTVKKKEIYHIFRFSSHSNNLGNELKGKWLIGWASENGNTFSNFDEYEKFEQKTVEKTLKHIRRKLL